MLNLFSKSVEPEKPWYWVLSGNGYLSEDKRAKCPRSNLMASSNPGRKSTIYDIAKGQVLRRLRSAWC